MHLSIMITSLFSIVFLMFSNQFVRFLISNAKMVKRGSRLLRFIALYQLVDVA